MSEGQNGGQADRQMTALCVDHLSDDFSGVAINQLPIPQPQSDEVQVEIRAATLGFPDLLMTRGAYQHKPDLPFISGGEIAGIVSAVGAAVSTVSLGDRVVTAKVGGGFAQFGCYKAEQIRPLPSRLDFASGAALSAAYLTAYVALVRRAHLQPNEWILVHGAAGGVGLAAVDLALHMGARVIAAASTQEKLDQIKAQYPVHETVISAPGFRDAVKQMTGGAGADVIYDPVGGDIFDESVRCINWNGRLLVIGFAGGRIPNISVNMPLIKGFSVVGVRAGEYGRREPEKGVENMAAIWQLAEEGAIRPYVCAQLPLEKWREAFAMMENREVIGRLVLCPQA